jgi:xylulokinase
VVEGAIFIIGCDVGTQSTKALLLDDQGVTVARAARSYPTRHPAAGWAEQVPEHWLDAIRAVVDDVLREASVPAGEVAALGIAAQVDGVVAVDVANRPLAAAPIWMDRRAGAALAAATDRLGGPAVGADRIRAVSGANADPSHGAPKIAWLRDALDGRPDGYLLPASFVVAHLTGRRTVDRANASCLLLMDVADGSWSSELLDAFGIDPSSLAELLPATEVAGTLRPRIAADWGVPAWPVVVGTGDEHAASVAADILRPGRIGDISGTAEPVAAASGTAVRDPEGLVETHAHVPPDRWLVEHPGFVSAGSVRWLAGILGCAQEDIGRLAAGAPAGADGVRFEPALGGASTPRWNADLFAAFTGLALGHDREHLARAVLEGCCFAVRDIVERLAAIGLGADVIRVVGGGARDRTWLQIKADVTGREIELLAEPEATALGAALVAAVGVGMFADLDAAAAATLRLDPVRFTPDAALSRRYDEAWASHRATFDALEPLAAGTVS